MQVLGVHHSVNTKTQTVPVRFSPALRFPWPPNLASPRRYPAAGPWVVPRSAWAPPRSCAPWLPRGSCSSRVPRGPRPGSGHPCEGWVAGPCPRRTGPASPPARHRPAPRAPRQSPPNSGPGSRPTAHCSKRKF